MDGTHLRLDLRSYWRGRSSRVEVTNAEVRQPGAPWVMPRYFFDVTTSERHVRDEVGIQLSKAADIWPEIARLIHDCVYVPSPGEGARLFDIFIRDENGTVIERCTSTSGSSRP